MSISKILIIITILLPIVIISLFLALHNFDIKDMDKHAKSISSFSIIQANTSSDNPITDDTKAAKGINGAWYLLTCITGLFAIYLLWFGNKSKPE